MRPYSRLAAVRHATDYLSSKMPNRRDYVNITYDVEDLVRRAALVQIRPTCATRI